MPPKHLERGCAMNNKKLRKMVVWVLILVVIAGALIYFLSQKSKISFKEETAKTQSIETYYTFSGNIEPDGFKAVTAASRGTVKAWNFAEGDKVSEDDEVMVPKSGAKVKSPMDGTISDLYVDEGEDYLPGDALFRVADYDHPLIRIKVDEYDVSALTRGMRVSVKVQATGKVLDGTITRIAQEATVSGDLAYYEAEITLPQDGTLAMGLTCEVSVNRESVKDATTVSMDAIQYDENGKPFVYCYDRNGDAVRQSVLLGINNGTIVEIRDGVRTGETVLIPPTNIMLPMMKMMNR